MNTSEKSGKTSQHSSNTTPPGSTRDYAMGRMFLVIATVFPALFLGGCIFPAAAPSGTAVEFGAQASFQYHLVPLTKETADILATEEPEGFGNAFRDRKPPTAIKFGVGIQ